MESDLASTFYTDMPDSIRPGKAHHRGVRGGRNRSRRSAVRAMRMRTLARRGTRWTSFRNVRIDRLTD